VAPAAGLASATNTTPAAGARVLAHPGVATGTASAPVPTPRVAANAGAAVSAGSAPVAIGQRGFLWPPSASFLDMAGIAEGRLEVIGLASATVAVDVGITAGEVVVTDVAEGDTDIEGVARGVLETIG
jgi:hypothetical protein